MISTRKKTNNKVPLVIEPHPDNYDGYPFITLIRYNNDAYLTILNNSDDKYVEGYVLDLCDPNNVDEKQMVAVANAWYNTNREKYPVSIDIDKIGIQGSSLIYRTFNVDSITRLIGPLPEYNMVALSNVKRRKRKEIPANIIVTLK